MKRELIDRIDALPKEVRKAFQRAIEDVLVCAENGNPAITCTTNGESLRLSALGTPGTVQMLIYDMYEAMSEMMVKPEREPLQ